MMATDASLADFVDAVETVQLCEDDRWASLLEPLGRFLRAEPLLYGVSSDRGTCRVSFLAHPRGVVATRARADMDARLRATAAFGHYRVAEVAESQRNQPVLLSALSADRRAFLRQAGFDRYGLGEVDQLRVLLCDGSTMRAWFGGFRADDELFSQDEAARLGHAVPALRRRLELETQWSHGRLALAALEVALEAFGRPALIANGRAVQHPNRLARELHDVDPVGFAASIDASRKGLTAEWNPHRLVAPGLVGHTLWVRSETAAASLPDDWPISRKEREVLRLVVRGLTNAAIAGRLACSERTIEVHVARLLQVADCESRSALVAAVLRRAR